MAFTTIRKRNTTLRIIQSNEITLTNLKTEAKHNTIYKPIKTHRMFTESEAIQAIKARINGEWDDPQLTKLGALMPDTLEDIKLIIDNTI